MDDESSDILGQQTKPVLRGSRNAGSPGASVTVKFVLGFAILLVFYVVVMRIRFRILVWKERSYKLATRRRHGIPDTDHRPFHMAYAAVVRAKEASQKTKATQPVFSSDGRNAQTEQNVRQRFGLQATSGEAPRASSYSTRLPGAYLTEGTPARSHPESITPPPVVVGGGRYPSHSYQSSTRRYESAVPSYLNGPRRASKRGLELDGGIGGQKRGFVEDPGDEPEAAKRSKRGDWLIGDEPDGTVWPDQVPPQRGAKRYLFEEDETEDDLIERQSRDKRARKVSSDKGIQAQEDDDLDMEVDEDEDEVDDLPYIQRGKKRDRAEAGSTFGGEDDDSGIELDSPDSKPKRRTRKRRTFLKRKSSAGAEARGQKRDRDLDDEETDVDSGDETSYVLRKKRGKKSTLHDDELSEHSTTRSQTSSGSRNRAIGEEWSSNSIRWKVGPNGQRLRQALVKKTTQRFSMPEDSQHPDCSVDFEVYVESWLNDEEYRDAKQRHLLAGQDTPRRSDTKLSLDVQTQTNGKNLLWSSTSTPLDSPISRSPISDRALGVNQRIIRTSLSSASSQANPFEQMPAHSLRRISSISRASSTGAIGSPSLADSTNSSPHTRYKTYSKLEKQELEAQALMKLRELKSKKEAESIQTRDDQAAKEKENLDGAKGPAISCAIPTITVTTPSAEASKPDTQPVSLFNLSKPAEGTLKSTEAHKVPFPSSSDGGKTTEAPKPSIFPTPSAPIFPSAPSATAPKADDKPTVPAAAPSTSFFPLSTPASSTVPHPLPGTSFFSVPGAPAATSADNKPEQPARPPVSFNPPSSANMGFTTPQRSNMTSTNPLFSTRSPPAATTTSLFNVEKPSTTTMTTTSSNTTPSNPFFANTSQPIAQTSSSNTPTAPTTQPKFNFQFTGPTSTSTHTSAASNSSAPASAPSGNPFESKGPSRPMVSFTPLTPDGGTRDFKSAAAAPKTASEPSSFGFKPPTSGVNGDASKPPTSVFGTSGGMLNAFGTTSSSNPTSAFGTAFSSKPAESRSTEPSSSQPTKPLFNLGVTGQTSSSSASQGTTNVFGAVSGASGAEAAKPAPMSSSLFGALGPQQTTTFGSTSTPGASGSSRSTNIFGTIDTASSNSSAPSSVFGSKPTGASSGSVPSSIFGTQNAPTLSGSQAPNNPFGTTATKPAEAPKSLFGATPTPATNGATAPAAEQQKPLFKFQMPASSSSGTNHTGSSGATSTSTSGPSFTFKFGAQNTAGAGPSQTPVFGATSTSGRQSAFAAMPNAFNVGSTFGSAGGSSGFNPLGAASQTNGMEQK